MNRLMSPKQLARAIDASESSVKRWCDKGIIPTEYTAGGHRRIPISAIFKFIASNRSRLIRPEVLGLPATTGRRVTRIDQRAQQLSNALTEGDEATCRAIILDLYLAEHSLARIFDLVIAAAFVDIGSRWECGNLDVYQERHGCEITLRLLRELRALIPSPSDDAPIAVGGTTEGDDFSLATSMVELVLRDAKWNAISLGENLPFQTLGAAIEKHRPRLFWMSASHISDEKKFLSQYNELYESFGRDVGFVVGGQALNEPIRQQMQYAAYCDNMQHLEAFAQTFHDP